MGQDTANILAECSLYQQNIERAEAELESLQYYFQKIAGTDQTVLEKYLNDLQNHPAAQDVSHTDHQAIQQKIEFVKFNLNLILKPAHYDANQRSYTDRFNEANRLLGESMSKISDLDCNAAQASSVATTDVTSEVTASSTMSFRADAMEVLPINPTVAQGESITFRVNDGGANVVHQFWKYTDQTSSDEIFQLDTSSIELGDHTIRVNVTTFTDGAQQVTTLNAPFRVATAFDEADIQLELGKLAMTARCEFLGMENTFFSWVLDSPSHAGFRKVSNGLNVNQMQVCDLSAGDYRIRVEANMNGNLRRLQAGFSLSYPSRDEFVRQTAAQYAETPRHRQQDFAHDAILHYLLDTSYSSQCIASNDPNKMAYDAVRSNIGAPLLRVMDADTVTQFEEQFGFADEFTAEKYPNLDARNKRYISSIFIRDFMNLYTRGDVAVSNWLVEDNAIHSDFAIEFDELVTDINDEANVMIDDEIHPFSGMAHRDAIQIIPRMNESGSDQYAAATLNNVTISGNIITSLGQLQGIFGSDGAFRNLNITNNHLNVSGSHTITFNGMLSGDLSGNTDLDGNPLAAEKYQLYPLRIGGGANIFVIGFVNPAGTPMDEQYHYDTITGVPAGRDMRQRFDWIDPDKFAAGVYRVYDQVNMVEFHKEYAFHLEERQASGPQPHIYRAIMDTLVNNHHAVRIETMA